jgi:hypothetical protein
LTAFCGLLALRHAARPAIETCDEKHVKEKVNYWGIMQILQRCDSMLGFFQKRSLWYGRETVLVSFIAFQSLSDQALPMCRLRFD